MRLMHCLIPSENGGLGPAVQGWFRVHVEAFWEGPQPLAGEEVELLEAAQLSKAFGEYRVRPSGTWVVQSEWRMHRSVV